MARNDGIDRTFARNQDLPTLDDVAKVQEHNEREKDSYSNQDIDTTQTHRNVHFKKPTDSYAAMFDQMIADGVISTRGLKADAVKYGELLFDVNSAYFHNHGGYEYAKQFYADAYKAAVEIVGGEQYILSAVMHADERNRAMSEALGEDVYHYHLHVVYIPVVDMQPTAESIVSGLWPLLSFAAGLDISPQFGRVLNSKKVSDHHAIIPTMEFVQKGFDGLTEGEKKLLSLVCCKLLCAVAAPHVYEAVTATFTCAGNEFTAKGKTILTPGWKEIERRFKASFKTDADEDAPELARELPEITEGQTFDPVEASITEHFTTPPKPYTEDTLLSAMERAGAEDMPEDAERQGLGTPATRASILEKLVQMGFVERKGKQLLPTKDGHNLVCVLPEVLTSPQLTAEWETKLTAIAKGEADPEGFMVGIEEMTRNLIYRYSQISEDAQKLFQAERVVIGKCPRCGEAVYEGKKNYYCGNRACQFVMWKNDRFFEERGKTFTPKIAAALLKDGKAKVKGLRSMKTGKTYDGTVLLADTGGKYVNYRVEKKS
jgi:DNA topoisomerase-3